MFTELREALTARKALDERKERAPRTHSRASPRGLCNGKKNNVKITLTEKLSEDL